MIALSAIDEARFGIVTARDVDVRRDSLGLTLDFCQNHRVKLLIARCRAEDTASAQALEEAGARLMDTLVYYTRSLEPASLPENTCNIPIRPMQPGDAEAVRRVASESFKGYAGHYHADPRLDRQKCDEAYQSWAYRSCVSRDIAGEVLVADDGQVAGFATLRMNDSHEGEGVLFGVAPRAQGVGVYRGFMVEGMRWCLSRGATHMIVSTQIPNLQVQRVWIRLGFEPTRSCNTFHLWFSRE